METKPKLQILPEIPETTMQPVLIIYSRDHPNFTKIVLKLCAFLRAKCGTEVYLDLLDTTTIGAMGRLPWIEFQMRRIEQSTGKVLVLCSPGMQAKWGAICGGPRVHLREDVCSTMGDMLTPALQLITPDMQRPASYGKYLVAYFEDICSEYDVPSMFDVAVKYKLMKHFEELFFRILDQEKYQQGKVHTIEEIGIDEYFNCPSGKALRDAIKSFQAYQLENPDWFEKECLESDDCEAEAEPEVTALLDQCTPPIHQYDPVLNDGPSVYECEVEMHDMDQAHSVRTTEIPYLNSELEELLEEPSGFANIHPAHNRVYSLYPDINPTSGIYTGGVHPPESQPWLFPETVPHESSPPSRNGFHMNSRSPADGCSADDVEEGLVQLQNLQVSLASFVMAVPPPSLDDYNYLTWDTQSSQPVEIDESEVEEVSGKRPSRWSDQGYSSRDSREEPPPSSLAALAKLQEALYLNSPMSSGFGTETIES